MPKNISVITPSFNQAEFLPRTLKSVAMQLTKPIEHIVYDPGSTDGSREIAAADQCVTLVAEADKGQADAVARGMQEVKGDIIAWINSDDEYFDENVFCAVREAFESEEGVDIVFGDGIYIDQNDKYLRDAYVIKNPSELNWRLAKEVGILQPATFISKTLVDRIGAVDPDLQYCMDYEYWIRALQNGASFKRLNIPLARARYYENNKTFGLRGESLREVVTMVKSNFGFVHSQWVRALADFELNGHDGILKKASISEAEGASFQNYLRELMWRINGDRETYDKLAKLNKAKIIGDTLNQVKDEIKKQEFVLPTRTALGEKDPPMNRGYTVGEQRWAYHRPWLEKQFQRSDDMLETLRTSRQSDVCVIAGNGPSLNHTDFEALKEADVFITNYAFMNQKLAECAKYLCVTNYLVAEQEAASFNLRRDFIKFVPYWLSYCLLPSTETCYIRSVGVKEFGTDFKQNISWRSTVSYFAMQIAYVLGYKKVLLVGFDHSYYQPDSTEGDLIDQKTDDPNHFDPRYFKNKKWQAADTNNMEEMYKLAKTAFDSDGREIVNCTVGGQLELFRRGHLGLELLNERRPERQFSTCVSLLKDMPITERLPDKPFSTLVSPLKDTPIMENETDDLAAVIKQLPRDLQFPIFLPTDRIAPEAQLEGINRVRALYEGRIESHREKLRALKKARTSDRCVIIGNGPSLNQTDLSLLKDVDTFAVNGFFLKSAELGWKPTYYVVEDHLVAEDRAPWINALKGSHKLFPASLAYCLEEDEETIFFDHRPRKSYPHGFDFSEDASINTFTGCTVTYTCMQLAHYLGYKEIYLVGVDASYQLPSDVKQDSAYGTGVLDMKSDDPNHFHPDYFGKGFRWHDPQVDKMLEAYAEARKVTDRSGRPIYNATVGGKLEVFERRALHDVFPKDRSPEPVEARSPEPIDARSSEHIEAGRVSNDCPRILVFDLTAIGDGTATGEIKRNLFGSWPADRYLQVYNCGGNRLGVKSAHEEPVLVEPSDLSALHAAIKSFNPELILYRPVPDAPLLHSAAMDTIREYGDVPLATWIMDDWPARLEAENPEQFLQLEDDWRALLASSNLRMSISQKMSEMMGERYGFDFEPFANGVDLREWEQPISKPDGPFTIRYAGGLADNMTAQSVLRVAQAVEKLANAGHAIRMEIRTRPFWYKKQAANYNALQNTSFLTELLSPKEYRSWLSSADAVLISYNFDPDSLRYIGSSLANKMPECLASGAPLIAHGPIETATLSFLSEQKCAKIIAKPDVHAVAAAILSLINHPDEAKALAEKARSVALTHHNVFDIRARFAKTFAEAVKTGIPTTRLLGDRILPERSSSDRAQVDTAAVVTPMPTQSSTPTLEPAAMSQKTMLSNSSEQPVSPKFRQERAWYAPFGNAVRKYAPALFPFLQRIRQIVWKLIGSPAVWLAASGGLAAIGLTLEGPWPLEQRFILAGGVLGAAGLAALALMAWRLRRYIANLSAQNRALFSEIERIHDLTKAREARAERMTGHQERLTGEIARLRSESSKTAASVRQDFSEVIVKLEERLMDQAAEGDQTAASVRQDVSKVIANLEERLLRQVVKGDQAVETRMEGLHQRLNAVLEEQARLKEEAETRIQAAMKDLTQRMSGVEEKANSGVKALSAAKEELEESMKALRQGLEQRMFAEIDEYAKGTTSELIARLDAIEAAQTKGDAAYKTGLAALKKTLDDELKPEVGEVREIAASARTMAAEARKAVWTGEIISSRLRERTEASERQIGALRYPDAPDVFVYFGHHKCASRFFRYEVFGRIADSTGARTRKYEIKDPPFHYSRMDELDLVNIDFKELGKDGRDVVWFANASQRCLNKIKRNAGDWKGLRIIRDPRQVLISNYIHHKGDHPDESPLGWIWDQLVKDKPILRELPEEDGIMHELDNISKQVIEDQILAPFDNERVMTVRLEDFTEDPRGHLLQISEFLKVPDVAGIDFGNTKANPDSGPWQKYFTSRIREAFKERYGQALIDLGYAEDMDW